MGKVIQHAGNEDDHVHLAYFDYQRQLSFVMNEMTFPFIKVGYGGYGEPAFAMLDLADHSDLKCSATFDNVTPSKFEWACREWAQTNLTPGFVMPGQENG
jgi:hypothetical protein